jgi:hypothetical protein
MTAITNWFVDKQHPERTIARIASAILTVPGVIGVLYLLFS